MASFVTRPPRLGNGRNPKQVSGVWRLAPSGPIVSARRESSEITTPKVFFWRRARSRAACKTSLSISNVVLMHQMSIHFASHVNLSARPAFRDRSDGNPFGRRISFCIRSEGTRIEARKERQCLPFSDKIASPLRRLGNSAPFLLFFCVRKSCHVKIENDTDRKPESLSAPPIPSQKRPLVMKWGTLVFAAGPLQGAGEFAIIKRWGAPEAVSGSSPEVASCQRTEAN